MTSKPPLVVLALPPSESHTSGIHPHLSSSHFLTDPLCPQGANIISLKFLGGGLRWQTGDLQANSALK